MKARVQWIRCNLVVTQILVHAKRAPISTIDHAALKRCKHFTTGQSDNARSNTAPNCSTHAFWCPHLDALLLEVIDRVQRLVKRHGFLSKPNRAYVINTEFSIGFTAQFGTAAIFKPQLRLVSIFKRTVQFGTDL